MARLPVLDGWRGLSILSILVTHMLPLGPESLGLHRVFGALGMCIFFTLSGFLITGTLVHDPSVRNFAIRRVCRIVPIAWLFSLIALPLMHASAGYYSATLLFYANIPPYWLTSLTGHLWSVCLEMQFYLFIGTLFALTGRRGLFLLPLVCVAVTAGRVIDGVEFSYSTRYRVDEILSGATLALVYEGMLGTLAEKLLSRANWLVLSALLLISCHPGSGGMNYLRPYFAAALVGSTVFQGETWLARRMLNSFLGYCAEISYALYVIHPLTYHGWMGQGSTVVRFIKRPFSFALAFGGAHLSTRYYESRWIAWGKRHTVRTHRVATIPDVASRTAGVA